MNYEIALLRAAVGFKVQRPGFGFVTGTGQHDEADDYGSQFVQNEGGELVEYKPTDEDKAALDWEELAS